MGYALGHPTAYQVTDKEYFFLLKRCPAQYHQALFQGYFSLTNNNPYTQVIEQLNPITGLYYSVLKYPIKHDAWDGWYHEGHMARSAHKYTLEEVLQNYSRFKQFKIVSLL